MSDYVLKKAGDRLATAIQSEITARRNLYQERDTVMHNIRRQRLMRQKTYMPKGYQRKLGGANGIKMPVVYRMVQTAVSSVAKRMPSVYVEPMSVQDRKRASEMTRAVSLLLQAMDAGARPHLYGLYYTLFGDGLGVKKTQPGPWGGFPLPDTDEDPELYNARVAHYLREHPLPFYSRVVDPLTCYPPLDEYGEGVFVESGWRATKEFMRSLRLMPEGARGRLTQIPDDHPYSDQEFPPGVQPTTRVDEVWSDDKVAIVIHGHDTVYTFENPMEGDKPYTWGYADPTGVEDPTNIGMSVAFPLYNIAPWIDTMTGIMLAWSMFGGTPTMALQREPGPGVRATQELSIKTFQPGMLYDLPVGAKLVAVEPPGVGPAILGNLNFLVGASDRGGLPSIVSGGDIGSRMPALTFSAAFEAATDRLKPAAMSAEKIIAGDLRKALKIIGRYNTPIAVNGWEYAEASDERVQRGWARIKPAEARKDRQIVVSLAVDSTQDMIAKGTHSQFMVDGGLWELARGMRFGGVENPEREKEGIDADYARRAMQPIMARAAVMGDPDMAALLQAEAEEDEGGEGETGKPPGPGRNRKGVPAGRGGGKRGGGTHKPRGNRQGKGKAYGRT